MRPKWWLLFCLGLLGLGLIVSGYLLARHLAIIAETVSGGVSFCQAIFGSDCDEALQSPLAVQFGIPLAGWGIVFYGTVAAIVLLGWTLGETFELEAVLAALMLALVAAGVSIVLGVLMATGRAPFCPLCVIVHVINLVLPIALKQSAARSHLQLAKELLFGLRYVFGANVDQPVQARWKVIGLFTAALVGLVLYQWVLIQTDKRRMAAEESIDSLQIITDYRSNPQLEIAVGVDDPRLGPQDAPVEMVLFSSFQCPGCRSFAHTMSHLIEDFEGRLTIVFKHYPLGKACNPSLSLDRHPQACAAARAAEAARLQGKFWSFHDGLFARETGPTEEALLQIAVSTGLDRSQFDADRAREVTAAKVAADVEMGNRLGVDGTPVVFLNNRRVPTLSLQALKLLIVLELDAGS